MVMTLRTYETVEQIKAHAAAQPTKGIVKINQYETLPALAIEGKPFPTDCVVFRRESDISAYERIHDRPGLRLRRVRIAQVLVIIDAGTHVQGFTAGLLTD